jgi:hypothetical protein
LDEFVLALALGGAAGFAVQGRGCHDIQPFSREGASGGGANRL